MRTAKAGNNRSLRRYSQSQRVGYESHRDLQSKGSGAGILPRSNQWLFFFVAIRQLGLKLHGTFGKIFEDTFQRTNHEVDLTTGDDQWRLDANRSVCVHSSCYQNASIE